MLTQCSSPDKNIPPLLELSEAQGLKKAYLPDDVMLSRPTPSSTERAPHVDVLLSKLKDELKAKQPDVGLEQTPVSYLSLQSDKTGTNFEMAFVKFGSQEGTDINTGKQVHQELYYISYLDKNNQPQLTPDLFNQLRQIQPS